MIPAAWSDFLVTWLADGAQWRCCAAKLDALDLVRVDHTAQPAADGQRPVDSRMSVVIGRVGLEEDAWHLPALAKSVCDRRGIVLAAEKRLKEAKSPFERGRRAAHAVARQQRRGEPRMGCPAAVDAFDGAARAIGFDHP